MACMVALDLDSMAHAVDAGAGAAGPGSNAPNKTAGTATEVSSGCNQALVLITDGGGTDDPSATAATTAQLLARNAALPNPATVFGY